MKIDSTLTEPLCSLFNWSINEISTLICCYLLFLLPFTWFSLNGPTKCVQSKRTFLVIHQLCCISFQFFLISKSKTQLTDAQCELRSLENVDRLTAACFYYNCQCECAPSSIIELICQNGLCFSFQNAMQCVFFRLIYFEFKMYGDNWNMNVN